MMEMPGHLIHRYADKFSHISFGEHILLIIKQKWWKIIVGAIPVFGVIWTFVEASSYFTGANFAGKYIYFALGLVSLLCASVLVLLTYFKTPPTCLDDLPVYLRQIAMLRKQGWEYHFMYCLLKKELTDIDAYLSGVLDGLIYLDIAHKPTKSEYVEWLDRRPENLMRMLEVAQRLVTDEFAKNMFVDMEGDDSVARMIVYAGRIKDIYQKACDYEDEGKRIKPPVDLADMHAMQSGWSRVIRNGMNEFMVYLEEMSKRDRREIQINVTCQVVFNPPDGMAEFVEKMEKLKKTTPLINVVRS